MPVMMPAFTATAVAVASHLSRRSWERSSGPFRPRSGEGRPRNMACSGLDLLGRPSPEHRCGLCSTSPKPAFGRGDSTLAQRRILFQQSLIVPNVPNSCAVLKFAVASTCFTLSTQWEGAEIEPSARFPAEGSPRIALRLPPHHPRTCTHTVRSRITRATEPALRISTRLRIEPSFLKLFVTKSNWL